MVYSETPHLYVFTGHYGSGKTEVAVNFAMDLKKQKPDAKVALIDLDIINPFFRSTDVAAQLKDAGVILESMANADTNVDAPALTGKMGFLISDPDTYVILDIGGDDLGARACGYYAEQIASRSHTIYFVLNPYRPFTANNDLTMKIFTEVQAATLLKIDGIIDNSNILDYTDGKTIAEGSEKVSDFAKLVNLPVMLHAVMTKNNDALATAKNCFAENELLVMGEYITLFFDRMLL